MVTLNIDGREVQAEEEATILDVARAHNIYIPALCYHEEIAPYGACRLCMVEITKDDQFKYDLDAVSSFPNLVSTSGLTNVASIGATIVSDLASAGRDEFIDFSSSDGTGKGFYGDKHINVLLELMQKKK